MTELRGHNVRVEGDGPAPKCQYPGCHRRSEFLYRDRYTDERIYRPWCGVHRPGRLGAGMVRPTPRAYPRDGVTWPEDVKCPHCHRKREPRVRGELRPTCRLHRGTSDTGIPRPPGRPPSRPARRTSDAPKRLKTTPRHIRRATTPPPDRPIPSKIWQAFPFRDNGRAKTIKIPVEDRRILRKLWETDIGHFPAATDSRLTRKYPTSAISALWNYWYEKEGT